MKHTFMKILVPLLLIATPLFAAPNSETENDWEFNLAPFYVWGINIDGDLSAGPQTAPIWIPEPTFPLARLLEQTQRIKKKLTIHKIRSRSFFLYRFSA